MNLKVTVLGCGSSPGVPRIGNDWGVCDPNNPKNRRRRCCLLVERLGKKGITRVIVDTGPDFREQCLSENIDWVDAVLYTHSHADHIHGIDDLRAFALNHKKRVPIFANKATLAHLYNSFEYCFKSPKGSLYSPILQSQEIFSGQAFTIKGAGGSIEVMPFNQQHGNILSLGFRFGPIAYSSDISALPEKSRILLTGLSLWIVDALKYKPHPSHFSVEQAKHVIASIRPNHALLTHMHNEIDYETLKKELPPYIEPAYDGWQDIYFYVP